VSLTSPNSQPAVVAYGTPTASGGAPPVAVSCTPASQTVFPIGATTVTCTATDARQRAGTCTFAVTVSAAPTIALTRFVAFGDSLTRGEDGTAAALTFAATGRVGPRVYFPPAKTYPGVLQQLLASRYTTQQFSVFNEGNPGERVTNRATLSRFSAVVSGGQLDAVLLMEGANDLADRDDRVTAAAIANIRQMLRDARSRNVRPFLATIPPEVSGGFRALAWSLVAPFNDQLRALAAAEGVTLVDVYAGLITDTSRYIGFDGLHLTEEGNAKVAEVFFTVLKSTLERPPTLSFSPGGATFGLRR
jgi:lysophospholipase L1-like esterase